MTSITRNLPWFIRDLGVSIVGQKCYTSLVENLDVSDLQCIKYSISKGLGLCIVVAGSMMKVPQLRLILNAKSARGLSFPGYILETLSYAITFLYSFRNEFPFSTYGENFFMTLQNIIIINLIIAYGPTSSLKGAWMLSTTTALFAVILGTILAPLSVVSMLQVATLPLSLSSKVPQIISNARAKSTGQLSAVAVFSQIFGCIVRLFTSLEVNDPILTTGFAVALVLNLVIGTQMWMFWGKAPLEESKKLKREDSTPAPEIKTEEVKAPVAVRAYDASSTLQQRAGSPGPGGRKWARKVE
ncbi:Mannose-P-dolichol utilization defect 1 protein-like protein [Mycena chlorophos]|uniref:Mannose-P-dolichol utilization defect 1 protein homolog n=1 Tax=Mycena chlorophos TaxID=658473 RepID=A0A8H6STZ0_MYCCL|nr:Mannose-P-dolichol utilization defect 1 protein-like protein [Mycena chlorophos]